MARRSRSTSMGDETPSNQSTRRVTRSASQDLTTTPTSKRSRTRSQSDLSTEKTKTPKPATTEQTPDLIPMMDTGTLIKTPDIVAAERKSSSKKKRSGNKQKKSPKGDPMEIDELVETPTITKEKKDSSAKKKTSKKSKKQSKEDSPVVICDTEASQGSKQSPSSEKVKKTSKKKRKKPSQNLTDGKDLTATPPKKQDPIVDVAVHRIRNLNYHPKPIITMAAEKSRGWLAISRESGYITLKTIVPKLRTVSLIAGTHRNPMTVLAWTNCDGVDPVLICASRNDGTLYVADFWKTGQLTARTLCAGGGIFCMETIHPDSVAVGCNDGSIRIFSVRYKNDQYELQSTFTIPSAGSPVLSIAAHPGQKSVLFASIADGTIRRYDCHTINNSKSVAGGVADSFFAATGIVWKSSFRITVECLGRSTPTRVWALKVAKDGTVVSGDSLGHVQFWDGNTGTLISSFEQNDNKADVLDLDMTLDECKVFASGVDSRVICIERSTPSRDGTNKSNQWIMTHAQRPHTHDVKAVVIVPRSKRNGTLAEILCTGGLDTKLCTYSIENFDKGRPRTLYPWPGLKDIIAIARSGRIIAMMREDRVDIYKLAKKKGSQVKNEPVFVQEDDIMIGSVQLEGFANLMSCSLSDDGRLLAVTDSFSLVLFCLVAQEDKSLVVSKLPLDLHGMNSIVAVRFLDNGRLVFATADGQIVIVAVAANEMENNVVEVDRREWQGQVVQTLSLPTEKLDGKEHHQLLPVHAIVKSDDGNWFANIQNSSGIKDGKVNIFGRVGGGDDFQFWWTIPSLNSTVTSAIFLAINGTAYVAIACLDFSIYLFDIEGRRLSKWSETAGFPVSKKLPVDIAQRNDYPVRLAVDSASPSTLLLGSFGAILAIDTKVAFPQQCKIFPETHVRGKRHRSMSLTEPLSTESSLATETSKPACMLCLRYNSMLCLEFIDKHEMVIVEQPWLNVVATFPDALQRRLYGT